MRIETLAPYHRALLLQGPMTTFFRDFADWWEEQGRSVWKINFNGGDRLFFNDDRATDFVGRPEDFAAFVRRFILFRQVDVVFCFGDCRHYHQEAKKVASDLGVAFYVFEEGYFRPYYITLEAGGVNGYSQLPKDPQFYRKLPKNGRPRVFPTKRSFFEWLWCGFFYNLVARLTQARFPHYVHHKRGYARFSHIPPWVFSGIRRLYYRIRDRSVEDLIAGPGFPPYFVVALQVFNDSQIVHHSGYRSVALFLRDVMASFAKHAKPTHRLFIKHHPMDLTYAYYGGLIARLTKRYKLEGRIHYVHLPRLMPLIQGSQGVVTINSTVGFSALQCKKPLKAMGRAIYNMPGLTFQGSLADFWRANHRIDTKLYRKFADYVVAETQINGNFYDRVYFFDKSLEKFPVAEKRTEAVADSPPQTQPVGPSGPSHDDSEFGLAAIGRQTGSAIGLAQPDAPRRSARFRQKIGGRR